jgi:t-SNARE complex subunit (syntaxin)
MTCDQAERIADRAIRKARWPIGNIVTIAIIAALIAVTVLAFVLGRR